MKLSLRHYDMTYSVEADGDEQNLAEIVEALVIPLLLAVGFAREAIDAALGDEPVKEIEHG